MTSQTRESLTINTLSRAAFNHMQLTPMFRDTKLAYHPLGHERKDQRLQCYFHGITALAIPLLTFTDKEPDIMPTLAQQEIVAFNFHYLSMLQHQLLTDPLKARYVFNVDEEIANILISLNSHQLVNLSNTHRLLCDFTLISAEQLQRRLEAPTHLQDAHRAHAAILKASQRRHRRKTPPNALWGDEI